MQSTEKALPARLMSGGGACGQLIREINWTESALGAPREWPHSLKSALSLILRSAYPMFIWWGPELIEFHNDAYIPVLGDKHPHALGKSARDVWAEIWNDIGPLAEAVFRGGEVFMQDHLLFLERKGFSEETYWTFSYSPILDEEGNVGGLFCACNEETGKIVGQRRMRVTQDIASLSQQYEKAADLGAALIEVLHKNTADIPFCCLYLPNDSKTGLVKISDTRDFAWPDYISLTAENEEDTLMIRQALERGTTQYIQQLPPPARERMDGALKETAAVLPLQRGEDKLGILICGISPHLEFRTEYENYLHLVSLQAAGAISDVKAFEAEQRRAEALQELAASKYKAEQELFSLFMQAPVGILILSGDEYMVKLVNEAYLPIVQRRYEEMIGRPVFEALPEVASQGFREIMDEVRATAKPFTQREHRTLLFRNGREETTFLNIVYQPMLELDGSCQNVMILVHEVTEQVLARVAMEEVNHLLEEQVEERTQDLRQANMELERSNKELEQFAYAASHDMQEPLRKIQTFGSFLNDHNDPHLSESSRKYIVKIQESARRMSGIIEDLLNYSFHTAEHKMVSTSLSEVVQHVIEDLELVIKHSDASIIVDDLPEMESVPGQMHQLFYNLLNNSLKFIRTDVKPRITVGCRIFEENDRLWTEIRIEDNGIGFEAEYADKIFQLFKRLNDRRSYAGSGIGLALCKKIVSNHNGTIMASSAPEQGAVFTIRLPLQQLPA